MYRIDDASAATALPTPEAALAEGYWTEGNPGIGVAATLVRASFLNMVQEELRAVVVAAGLTPSKTTYNQVLTAIQTVLQKSSSNYAVATGTANAHTIALTPALTARTDGMPLRYKAPAANTGAVTLTDGVGTVAVIGSAHAALQGGEYIANGDALVVWNSTINSGTYILLECTGGSLQVSPATQPQHAVQLGQVSGVVGQTRNLVMSVATASATATMTADEIVVETALGGLRYCLPNFNKTINLGTTGAGGMDAGTAPTSGFVALYAIWNPTASTAALLATNATSAMQPNVYGGANMPSGYTASALVSIWPTNASRQLNIGQQFDRKLGSGGAQALNTTTVPTSYVSLSIASIVPPNAQSINGNFHCITSSAGGGSFNVSGASSGMSFQQTGGGGTTGTGFYGIFRDLFLSSAQTMFYAASGSMSSADIEITGYSF